MVATPEEIVNLGFDAIGESPIVTISAPTNKAEKFAARNYPQARDALLRSHIWTFSKKWFKLTAESATTLDPDHPFGYKIPAEAVRTIRPSDADWHIVGRQLYSGVSGGLTVLLIRNDVPVPDMDPLFVDALAAMIAIRYAETRTQSANKKQIAATMFKDAIHLAKSVNALEEPAKEVLPDHASMYLAGHDGEHQAALARRAVDHVIP